MTDYMLKLDNIYNDGFGIIPNSVLRSKTLTTGEKVLYAYFSSLLSNGNIELPSFETIAKDLNINEKMVKEYFNHLIANGCIEKTEKEDQYSDKCYIGIITK